MEAKYLLNTVILLKNVLKKRGKKKENGKFTDYGKKRNLERDRYNVWDVKVGSNQSTKDKIAFNHPAIFPEQLANDHIISWSNEGDLVYDCFMGSGTTAKMSILSNRNWIGSELSNEYCEIIEERIKKAWEEKRKEKDFNLITSFGDGM